MASKKGEQVPWLRWCLFQRLIKTSWLRMCVMSFQVQLHLRHPIGTEAPPISPCLGVPRCWSCHRPHRFGGEGVLIGGQNSNTKCSMTFVNIAVAISALAGGGGGQKRFRTETRIRWCFRHFSRIFGCLSARGYWNGILGHFGSFPAMEKRPKMKKTLYIARFCRVFGCQSIENTAKTSVLDWRYSKKRVNYRMLDWKHYKNTVKSNVLEGFTAFMAKNV